MKLTQTFIQKGYSNPIRESFVQNVNLEMINYR